MSPRRPAPRTPIALLAGLALGVTLAGVRPSGLRAEGGDRSGESVLAAGPIAFQYNAEKRVVIPQDALYYLDYAGARLVAAVPSLQQSVGGARVLGDFAERDLIADFGLPRGATPHFLMTTGSLGAFGGASTLVYVVETSSRQIAAYRLQEQRTATSTRPRFELLERRPIGRSTLPPVPGS